MANRRDRFDEWDSPSKRRGDGRATGLMVGGAVLFIAGLLAGVGLQSGFGLGAASLPPAEQYQTGALLPSSSLTATDASASGSDSNVITRIYKKVRPSIFTLTVVTGLKSKNGPSEDIGTGFLVNNDGDIATNDHVVAGASTVTVTSATQTYTGTVISQDPLDDLAIVHISPPPGLQPLVLGTAETLQPGQLVIAIGNPFQLTASVSAGIVSGLNRSMPTKDGRVMDGLVQTDAALNPGNSGGPLLNQNGQVVGIDTAIESPIEGSVGIGFAIPINRLERLLPSMLKGETISHPWIGIEGIDIDPGLQAEFHLPVGKGVLVVSTVKNGPAAKAGIHGDTGGTAKPVGDGDIIVGINGKPIGSVAALTGAINQDAIGTVVQLDILRHGAKMKIDVTLGRWGQ